MPVFILMHIAESETVIFFMKVADRPTWIFNEEINDPAGRNHVPLGAEHRIDRGSDADPPRNRVPRWVFQDYFSRHSDLRQHENWFLGLMSA